MTFNSEADNQPANQEEKNENNPQVIFKIGERAYDADSAITKITAQDEYIATLENKAEEAKLAMVKLEAEKNQSLKLEEALAKLEQTATDTGEQDKGNTNASVDLETLSKAAKEAALAAIDEKSKLEAEVAKEKQESKNFIDVQNALIQQFGSKNVDQAILDSGLTLEKAEMMAKDTEMSKILLQHLKVKTKTTVPFGNDINSATLKSKKPPLFESKVSELSTNDIRDKMLEMRAAVNR